MFKRIKFLCLAFLWINLSILNSFEIHLNHSNVCGVNSEYICKNVKINQHKPGKIIITDWNNNETSDILESIQAVYGETELSIGATYHALSYFENTINSKTFYIAIETTICEPYIYIVK